MSETRSIDNNVNDLFEILVTLWDGRIKIIVISLLATVIGIIFTLTKPNSYIMSTNIKKSSQTVFEPYAPLNVLLRKNSSSFVLDENKIFQMFVSEFNDYEEMITVLEQDEFVKDIIKDLNETDKEKALFKFAKSFHLSPPPRNKKQWILGFQWHDVSEGIRLFEQGINLTLKNIQKNSKKNIDQIASSIDFQNSLELEVIKNELKLIKKNNNEITKKRIQYLTEQSAIAKELGLEENTLNSNLLLQSQNRNIGIATRNFITTPNFNNDQKIIRTPDFDNIPKVSSNPNFQDTTYYLRGFKAIDKEISIIKGRSNEENLLMSEGYTDAKSRIFFIENDLSSLQLREVGKLIGNDNPHKWVEYDFSVGEVESKKKSKTYILLSIILGGIMGTLYVLISKGIRNWKNI